MPEALFTTPDPQLNANKQVAYRIIRDLLEANHWATAGDLIADDYIQHNPNASNGPTSVVSFFTEVLNREPTPIPETISMNVVQVVAEGDLVVVTFVREEPDPRNPGHTYTTTWFDM